MKNSSYTVNWEELDLGVSAHAKQDITHKFAVEFDSYNEAISYLYSIETIAYNRFAYIVQGSEIVYDNAEACY